MACGCESKSERIVLFQGDSVTDCGWDRNDPNSLGAGYPLLVASWYQAMFPEDDVVFLNRGISGNRVCDLQGRWKEDCLDLNPSLVSILIGINDTWRRYDSNDPTSTEAYEAGYRDILTRTVETLDSQIIMIEPFLLPSPEDKQVFREDLDPKINVVRKLAREFGATLIPMDGIFAQAAVKRVSEFWSPDGVHPTMPGHALIAQSWLDAVGGF
ncbi:MAG: SGNH/GDSL hydrolase family protein [Armatimonadota bacterium]|nr:SGNH/GDSL hydrolase family protein [bacterium]